jgi:hypothetical protein
MHATCKSNHDRQYTQHGKEGNLKVINSSQNTTKISFQELLK